MARTSSKTQLTEAIAYEDRIASDAAQIRGECIELTSRLFLDLWPLLLKPIPEGFLSTVGKVEGKPYASTGVSSVQVQIDRMNNVLTPMWWRDSVIYSEEGKLACVEIAVGNPGQPALVEREAWGGVNRGSTIGNIYKGSYTNAAKVALARVGPGHEVYLGATDLDPDVSTDAAKMKAPASAAPAGVEVKKLTAKQRTTVLAALADANVDLPMALGAVGVEAAEELTTAHAFELRELIDKAVKK